ncbi:MAG: branched-chain amino acid ABC transporter substrate-binding protein [Bacteroidota bacterium]
MSKRLIALISVIALASMVLAACGGAPGGGGAASGGTLKIVSSLPMTGASLTQTQTIVNAMKLRVDQAGGKACGGKYTLVYEPWDDASAALGKWDPAVETENANKAAADTSIVAYLGTFNSGAAKLSIPILNQAGPLAMISPANTYPGLTHAAAGLTEADEPDKYYPSGTRNYARVAATDDLQGPVAVNFMVAQGIKTLYILDDQEVYGKGVADSVNQAAQKAGITVVAQEGYDPKAADYKALMTKISTSNAGGPPDMVYLGAIVDNNAAQILKDKVAIMGDNTKVKFMGPDGIYTAALIEGAGKDVAEGVFASTPGLALKDLGDAGKKFYSDYAAKFGETKEPYAILGYDTMGAALKGIEDVCAAGGVPTDRAALTKAVMAIKDFDGALGKWSFDANGDITLPYYLIGQVQNGAYADFGTFTP